jgi:hypothetical protein
MDYLDLKKQAINNLILFVGYIFIAIAVVMTTIILVDQAYGFGLGKNGTVIQSGLAFFSSQPNPAKIYINGRLNPASTDTRLYLPEGIYKVSLDRSGYYDWQRTIELDGGSVEHFDYPFLFPKTLTTNKLQSYSSVPTLLTQSPDQRWLLVGKPGTFGDFNLYDLKNPTKQPTEIDLPATLLSKSTSAESWQLAGWADDNQHVLLEHDYDGKAEFILVDRVNPAQSVNLSTQLFSTPSTSTTSPTDTAADTKISFINKKYNQYYLYNSASQSLESATLTSPTKTVILNHVLAYQSYGNDTFLYVSDEDAPAGKVLLKMQSGGVTSVLHILPISPTYVIDFTEYNGTMYVAAGASSSNKVYIYDNPLGQLATSPEQAVTPAQVLHVNDPNYLSFSDNAQFIVAENGAQFGVYDIQNQKGYNYMAATAPDAPMPHAYWMDGDRLYYVSKGKLVIFDYDHTNQHTLENASSDFPVAFAPDYKYVYTLSEAATGSYNFDQTWLLAPADR